MSRRVSTALMSVSVVALLAAPAAAQDFLGGLLRSTAESAASRIVNHAVTTATSPRAPAASPAPPPAAQPARPSASAPSAQAPSQTAVGVQGTRTAAGAPSGWVDDGVTPAPYGTQPDEARRRQAFRDSNLFRRNSLPAEGPVNGWYQHNPNWDRQENCNTMLARGQMPQDPARNACRRP